MEESVKTLIRKAESGTLSREEAIILSEATRSALKHMVRLNIPLIPTNFDLWFIIFLRLIMKGITKPTDEEILQVYNEMVREKEVKKQFEDRVTKLQEETKEVLKRSGESILRTIESLDDHEKFLMEKEESILSAKDIRELKELIDVLLKEIKALKDENKALKDELKTSVRRINVLKDQLRKTLEKSSIDPLTNVANRGIFERELRKRLIRFERTGEKFSLIISDLDDFKRVNDLYGHLAGDEILREFAYTLRKDLRMDDLVARYGGEEFAVILSGLSLKEAVVVAERLRKKVEQITVKWDDNIIRISASFGVAEVHSGDSSQSIIQRADEALYLAKMDGKNCVRSEIDVAVRKNAL